MTDTEFWRFGEDVTQVSLKYLNLRYRLLPYIYSRSAAITFNGSTVMRPLVMDFPSDQKALQQSHTFMFGPSLLVAPVTEPDVNLWKVYLPETTAGWIDFWSGEKFSGGQTIDVAVTLDKIPLFVKAGSIIPFGPEKQYTAEKSDAPWEIRIYPGANASFSIYEDEGDNYNYEQGKYTIYELTWDDTKQTLTIGDKKGAYDGMNSRRILNVVKVTPGLGIHSEEVKVQKTTTYYGNQLEVRLY
jgi:alpha-D-xyloside xylohydrolase